MATNTKEYTKDHYLSCPEIYEDVIDHCSYAHNAVVKLKPEKNSPYDQLPDGLDNSVGRALHWNCKDHGFESLMRYELLVSPVSTRDTDLTRSVC